MDDDKREQRLTLIKAMDNNQVPNANVLPNPVTLIRDDRDR